MTSKISPKSRYAKNVMTLMAGTGLAQALPIAISPILTRLYSPEEFGVFALFLAITAIVSVVVTGKYELAIMLPKEDKEAANIMVLSMALSFVVSGLLLVAIYFLGRKFSLLISSPEIYPWLFWIPCSTLLMGIYQSLNYWVNRKAYYSRLATSRVFQSGGSSLGQLGAGYNQVGASGLVGGQILGQLFATSVLARLIYKDDKALLKEISKSGVISQAIKYNKFPKYLIFAHGFNTASAQMAIVLLNTLFSATVAGFYMLTQRVMDAPIALVSGALGDVFRQEASHSYAHKGECLNLYKKTFKNLFLLAVIPFSIFFFIAPELFELIFGDEWRIAGEYAQILTPMFFLRFLISPLSVMFIIAEKQRLDLLWQVILFFTTSSAIVIGHYFSDVKMALFYYMLSYGLMFIINGMMTYRMAKGRVDGK